MAQVLVPLKDLVQAKTRLSGLLRPSERRALAQAMLEDVLRVLVAHPEIERVTLLSDDPAAAALARQWGLVHWRERELGCSGLNALVARASQRLLQTGEAPLLVMHADLPLLAPADISAVLAKWREHRGLVIGCDRHGLGTNLLACGHRTLSRFRFGPDSCAQHLAAARASGLPVTVLRRSGIGLDVDEPADLADAMAAFTETSDGHTAKLLRGTALGKRVALALASLSSRGQDSEVGDA